MGKTQTLPKPTPFQRDWEVVRGDDESITLEFADSIDISGCSFVLEIRDVPDYLNDDGAAIVSAVGSINGQLATCTVTRGVTATLNGPLWWSIRMTTATDDSVTLFDGKVKLQGVAAEPPA